MSKYEQIYFNDWFRPGLKNHKEQCCGCGLVHITNYKIDENGFLWMKVREDKRATAAVRRKFNFLPQEKHDD